MKNYENNDIAPLIVVTLIVTAFGILFAFGSWEMVKSIHDAYGTGCFPGVQRSTGRVLAHPSTCINDGSSFKIEVIANYVMSAIPGIFTLVFLLLPCLLVLMGLLYILIIIISYFLFKLIIYYGH